MSNIYKGTLGLIGNTPLVEFVNIENALGLEATILGKMEYFNPAGSVKDRIAKAMIEDAEYTVIDKLNGFLYFSIGNKLYTYRKGIDECVEVNLQGVNFDPIVSLNVIAHNDYKANIFVATYSETNKGKVYRLTPESTDSRNLTVEEVIDTEGAVKCITYW